MNSSDLECKKWLKTGIFFLQEKNYKEAFLSFDKSIYLSNDFSIIDNIVNILFDIGEYDKSKEYAIESLKRKDEKYFLDFHGKKNGIKITEKIKPEFNKEKSERNIISFSLWGNDESYLKGAILNAQLIPHVYPGWTPRFYVNNEINKKVIEILKNLGAQILSIEDKNLLDAHYMWRFLVADDKEVDFFICRDADSRVNVKESNGVFEWVNSSKKFHIIRDHICHVELMHGGLWGGITNSLPSIYDLISSSKEYHNSRFSDQFFLNQKIWPLIRDDVLIHDANYSLFSSKKISNCFQLPGNHHIGEGLKAVSFMKKST